MNEPLLDYYPLETLAANWNCDVKDILAFAASGKLLLSIWYTGHVSAPGLPTGSYGSAFVWCIQPDDAKLFLFSNSIEISKLIRAYTHLEDGTYIPCDNKLFSPVQGGPNKDTPTFQREQIYIFRDELLKFEEDYPNLIKEPSASSSPGLPGNLNSSSEKTIVTPSGTEWSDIQIRFLTYESIRITIGKERPIERTYKSFPFSLNSKNRKPRAAWNHLLELAIWKGCPRSNSDLNVKKVSDLQRGLKEIFPSVDGNPFGNYSKSDRGWPPKINLSISEQLAQKGGLVG